MVAQGQRRQITRNERVYTLVSFLPKISSLFARIRQKEKKRFISLNPVIWTKYFLILLGRPFYYFFLFVIIFFSFLGKLILRLSKLNLRLSLPKISFTIPRLKISLPRLLAGLPHLRLPRLSRSFQLPASPIPGGPSLPAIHIPTFRLPHFSLPKPRLSPFTIAPILLTLSLLYLTLTFYSTILKDLPSPKSLKDYQPKLTTQIFDRHGRLLYALYQDENRTLVRLEDIPLFVRQATIAIEDKGFYQHQGLSFSGIVRAIKRNLTDGSLQGGSTITQQLVKNTLLTREKTIQRKIKEVILAIHTELIYDKDTILHMYLNQVAYGGTAYGIQAAAQQYFKKNVSDLTLAQAAFLAGLPQAPTRYSPYGPDPRLARYRQLTVLDRMLQDGYITKEEHDTAVDEKITFALPATEIKAPHFVMYVRDLLAAQLGESLLTHGGLQVHTTLDLDLQEQAQAVVTAEVGKLKSLNVNNGAALILKPGSGEVLAMVGSKNYFDLENDGQVNLTLAQRQPGSAVKPINYALAFEKGATPSATISDSPVTFNTAGSPPWTPQNYDKRYHGTVTYRQALANSYNIPAVKLLAQNGISQMAQLGRNLGITTWDDESRLGLSLTLGAVEVKMIDLAKVYATFANLGDTVEINPIISITDSSGNPIPFNPCFNPNTPKQNLAQVEAASTCSPRRTLSPQTAYIISDILSDPQARASAFGFNSILNIKNHQVAVKTGTSNDLRDNWTLGYTKDFLVATWVGNNSNAPMHQIASGITGASPIWAKLMTELLAGLTPHRFDLPDSLIKVTICALTNTLPCAACPSLRQEVFPRGQEPKLTCTESQIRKILEDKLKRDLESQQLTVQPPTPAILPEAASDSRDDKKRRR